MVALLKVEEISFGYTAAPVFEQVSLGISPGQVLCLLGPNGSGKTTLLDCILGWLKPRAGRIMLDGADITDIPARQIARHVAYVPQIHEKTFPYLVKDIVLMGRASYLGPFAAPSEEDMAISAQALDKVGMSSFKERPYTQLSGGEGQLVMVARALAQQTPLIIMDEPTAHLDYHHELIILETIVKLIRDQGLSVLMATHNPNHAFYLQKNGVDTLVAMMKNQHIINLGGVEEVLSEYKLGELYEIVARIVDCVPDDGGILHQVVPVSTITRS
ncbi:MAG: ABC transporter ATP-binding protein [Syntrophomonadaceae bacterium]|nr:ABC transporter ATP-binding protein [Syntrophomonadaceae bacterium]